MIKKATTEFVFTEKSSLKMKFLMLLGVIILLLILGTLFYHLVEGWGYVDSFYFSATSLATRGYSAIYPTNAISKIFTAFYLFLGVAFIIYTLSSFIGYFIQYKEPAIRKRMDSIVKNISPPKKERWIVIKTPTTNKSATTQNQDRK